MAFLDRHSIEKGAKVWVLIDGFPSEITFQGLAPYRGFFSGRSREERKECSQEADFAAHRTALIESHMAKIEQQISALELSAKRLRMLLP